MVGVAAVVLAAMGGEAKAEATGYVDGKIEFISAACNLGGTTDATATYVGYYIDPANSQPKLNEVTWIHAIAANAHACGGTNFARPELILPPGMQLAISARNPVECLIGNGKTPGGPVPCAQTPSLGLHGGVYFGVQYNLAPGWMYETVIPVIYTQPISGASLEVWTMSAYGDVHATVPVYAPYQAPGTTPTTMPMPMPMPMPTMSPKTPAQPTPYEYTWGDDLALVGASAATTGTTLPVAFSNQDGTFMVTNYDVGIFADWARTPGVQRLAGDFNGDGRTDYALVGGPGWQSIPVASSAGNGSFWVTNQAVANNFSALAGLANVKALTGDFNFDGKTDIALVGGSGWQSLPVAYSMGSGTFNAFNEPSAMFASLAAQPNVKAQVGDFNRDGRADIVLTGGAGWASLPIAFSNGSNGTFNVTNKPALVMPQPGSNQAMWNFAQLAAQPGVLVTVADVDYDGRADITLAGGQGWTGIPVAIGYGDGGFAFSHKPVSLFPGWASTPGVKLVSGDFNGDGYPDLAAIGVQGWSSIRIAQNIGFGMFVPYEVYAPTFAMRAATSGVRVITGDFGGFGTDIALVGGVGWTTIPLAMSISTGDFITFDKPVASFGTWAADPSASVLVGPVNKP